MCIRDRDSVSLFDHPSPHRDSASPSMFWYCFRRQQRTNSSRYCLECFLYLSNHRPPYFSIPLRFLCLPSKSFAVPLFFVFQEGSILVLSLAICYSIMFGHTANMAVWPYHLNLEAWIVSFMLVHMFILSPISSLFYLIHQCKSTAPSPVSHFHGSFSFLHMFCSPPYKHMKQ